MKSSDMGGGVGANFNVGVDGAMLSTPVVGGAGASLQTTYRNTQDTIQLFTADLQNCDQSLGKVMESLQSMVTEVEILRHHYEEVKQEKLYLEHLLMQAETRTMDVRNIVQRFADVKDAVVASDGFTYERKTITDYITKCLNAHDKPVSQRAETVLTSLLIPNRSLKTLLDRLMDVLRTNPGVDVGGEGTAALLAANSQAISVSVGGAGGNANNNNNKQALQVGVMASHAKYPSPQTELRGGPVMTLNAARDVAAGASGSGQSRKEGLSGVTPAAPEVNARGDRLHPCLRVYGYCNYNGNCAYAKYPYDACLSHLKGKCRFRNQCHERHVDYRGPLNDDGVPLQSLEGGAAGAEKREGFGTAGDAAAAVASSPAAAAAATQAGMTGRAGGPVSATREEGQ